MSGDRTGTLIIRAWIEKDSSAPLRAHVRQTTDVSAGFLDGKIVTDEGAVADLVRLWLTAVLRDGATTTDATPTP